MEMLKQRASGVTALLVDGGTQFLDGAGATTAMGGKSRGSGIDKALRYATPKLVRVYR